MKLRDHFRGAGFIRAASREILPLHRKNRLHSKGAILLVALMATMLTGCQITDPDWQARQDGLATSPNPPQQWDPGFGHESRQMKEYERDNPWQ